MLTTKISFCCKYMVLLLIGLGLITSYPMQGMEQCLINEKIKRLYEKEYLERLKDDVRLLIEEKDSEDGQKKIIVLSSIFAGEIVSPVRNMLCGKRLSNLAKKTYCNMASSLLENLLNWRVEVFEIGSKEDSFVDFILNLIEKVAHERYVRQKSQEFLRVTEYDRSNEFKKTTGLFFLKKLKLCIERHLSHNRNYDRQEPKEESDVGGEIFHEEVFSSFPQVGVCEYPSIQPFVEGHGHNSNQTNGFQCPHIESGVTHIVLNCGHTYCMNCYNKMNKKCLFCNPQQKKDECCIL